MRNLCVLLCLVLVAPMNAGAGPEAEIEKLGNYVRAQASCASYISEMYSDYKGAGFASDKEAKLAGNEHLRLASYASKKLVNLFMTQDIEGERLGVRKGNQFCMGEVCFEKLEYLEALIFLGALREASDEVTRKPLSCPSGEWVPCTAAEPVDNRYYKAKDLYETGNCSLLLP